MNQWGPAIATAVVVVTLVQIVAFYYLMKGNDGGSRWASSASTEDGPGSSSRGGVPNADHDHDHDEATPDEDALSRIDRDETTQCPHCGTPNEKDQMFTFCRNCGSEL